MIDYKDLLEKYMRHVAECADMTYVGFLIDRKGNPLPFMGFTPEEMAALKEVDALSDLPREGW